MLCRRLPRGLRPFGSAPARLLVGAFRSAVVHHGVALALCTQAMGCAAGEEILPQDPSTASRASGGEASGSSEAEPPSPAGPDAESDSPAEPGTRELSRLAVLGFEPAPIFVPENIDRVPAGSLRVFVIAHGAGGRGEHHCLFWEPKVPPDVVLVCPEGSLLDRRVAEGGAYFPDHFALRRELGALILALKAKYSPALAEEGWRFIGYSQGATMGALAIVGEIPIFGEMVLIEGGGENWSYGRAATFRESGGRRVLLSCGTSACEERARRSVAALRKAGLEATERSSPGAGHTYAGGVGRVVAEEMKSWEAPAP